MLTFYAELLSNIRAITLSIHLSSPATASTRITVEPSASAAILHHHGESIRLPLPGNVNPEHQQRQYGTTVGTEHLSCRLEVAPPPPPKGENYAPWSAPELTRTESASFDCRKCGSTLIPRKRVKKWKDLPSGNWADMMDFWHCHKPDDDRKKKDEAEEGESAKYSTFGKGFAVERGTGLVDRLYFLLPADDCENVQIADVKLKCSLCETELGVVDGDSKMWKINKWNLRLNDQEKETTYPLECFLSSQIISHAEEGGVRRLLVTSEADVDTQANGIKIWIFNTDYRYTHTHSAESVRAVKLLWQTVEPGEKVPTDSLKATGFEGIALDPTCLQTLRKCLHDSNGHLPGNIGKTSMGQSGEWNVGSLRRFEEI
ncbi:ubiquitin-conjugating enzyme E2-binding protein [Tricharina praecox]|uniref:ubiquitin-conjugating enzyme E2-binding protein n=1 Tax=Tricharina praecox TaxID=43433 RepID=UPI00222085A2|nr:ubiquitin-conjugating enzyme E2-binding protein [Tricharina praecox]KAI5849007.1 ubiquitin-conjugating enzyme E2-binding protein [Tricharina praecox]